MNLLLPDDRWVRWLLVPAIVFISQATNDAYLVDFWHHLARGREMVRTGELLDRDIFTYTVPNAVFLDLNWLTQVVYFHLYSWGGLGLVRTVNALVLAGAWAWIVGICKRVSGSLEIAMTLGLLTFLGSWQVLTIRPQTVSIVLFVGLYDVLLRAEKDVRWLLVTPLFLALWANVHGAFPAGLMLLGMFTLGRIFSPLPLGRGVGGEGAGTRGDSIPFTKAEGQSRGEGQPLTPGPSPRRGEGSKWVLWLLACVFAAGATLVNPYTWDIYEYARQTSGIAAARKIDEWLPPSWDQGIGVAWFLSLPIAIGVIGWAWRKGRPPTWRELFLLLCFGFLAARSIRMVIWWLIILAPMLSVRLADFWPRSRHVIYAPSRGALFTVVGLLAFCVLSLPPLHAFNPLLRLRSPDETTANLDKAMEFLATKTDSGNIFTKLEWGEYIGWRGSPNWKVFMDGRIEIYPDDVWKQYLELTDRRDAFHRFRDIDAREFSNADFLVLDSDFHETTGLLLALMHGKHWVEIAREGRVVVFKRFNWHDRGDKK